MRRRAILVAGLAVFVSVGVASVWAMPILDVAGLENLEQIRSSHSRSLIGSLGDIATDSDLVFEPRAFSSIGTSGSADFSGPTFLETSALSSDCGSDPSTILTCWDQVRMSLPGAPGVVVPADALGQPESSDSNPTDPVAEAAAAPRQTSALIPAVFILLTSGLAAAGYAGWQTFLKDRRSTQKDRRRRISRRVRQ